MEVLTLSYVRDLFKENSASKYYLIVCKTNFKGLLGADASKRCGYQNQSVNQSSNQSINQLINQSINHNQSINVFHWPATRWGRPPFPFLKIKKVP